MSDEPVPWFMVRFLQLPPVKAAREYDPKARGVCEHPDCADELSMGVRAPVMTLYCWDGLGDDPNKPPILCAAHTDEWVSGWQERWDEYYGGML